jgi:hypothetical protein
MLRIEVCDKSLNEDKNYQRRAVAWDIKMSVGRLAPSLIPLVTR